MGGFTIFVGRVMLVVIFLASGISKLQDPKPQQDYLVERYNSTSEHIKEHAGFSLPFSTQTIQQNSLFLIKLAGTLEIVGAALIILNFHLGACLLCTFILIVTPIFHCPCTAKTNEDKNFQRMNIALNAALFGGMLLFIELSKKSKGNSKQ